MPLTAMLALERRKGKDKPVVRKALVDLEGRPFGALVAQREAAYKYRDERWTAYRASGGGPAIVLTGSPAARRAITFPSRNERIHAPIEERTE